MRLFLIVLFSGFLMAQAQTLSACEAALSNAVVVNESGWIFNDFDLADSFAFESYPGILPYIKALGQAFSDNGMIPIIALLPSRGMVYGEGLKDYDVQKARDAYQAFRNILNQNGFWAPDLLYAFQTASRQNQQVFFKLDHHWLPQGSLVTAQEVSNTLKQFSAYESLAKLDFTTTEQGKEDYKGSRLLQLEDLCGSTNSPNESFTRYATQALEAEASGGLFTDVERPKLLLLGTSNSEETMNFQGFLQQYSGLKVFKANMIGGAVLTPLENFLASDDYQIEAYRPPFVAWEFNVNTTLLHDKEILDFTEPLSYRQLIPALYGQCEAQSMLNAEGQDYLKLSNSVNLGIAGSNYYLVIDSDRLVPKFEVLVTYQNGLKEQLELVQAERLVGTKRYFLEFSDFFEGTVDTVEVKTLEGNAKLKAHICNNGRTQARNYSLKFQDLMTVNNLSGLTLTGLDRLELNPLGNTRWALGEQTKFSFMLPEAKDLPFEFSVQSPVENQTIDILFNGERQEKLSNLLSPQTKSYILKAKAGLNTLELNYADWNHGASSFSPEEPRNLSVNFSALRLGLPASTPLAAQPVPAQMPVVTGAPVVEVQGQALSTELNWDLARALQAPEGASLEGFGGVEGDAGRWAFGPEAKITFESASEAPLNLTLTVFNPIEGQGLEVLLNDEVLESLSNLTANSVTTRSLSMTAKSGTNQLVLKPSDWNGNQTVLSATDTRPMAAFIRDLSIYSGDAPIKADSVVVESPQPLITQATVTAPIVTEPVTEPIAQPADQPTIIEAVVTEPVITEPIVTEPVVTEPIVVEPVKVEPVKVEPIVTEPAVSVPVVSEPATTQTTATNQPVIVQAVVTTPQVSQPQVVVTEPQTPSVDTTALPNLNLTEGNLIATNLPQTIALEGMSNTEDNAYRWALGPETNLEFKSDKAQALEVVMDFFNPIDGQSLQVSFNGSTVQNLSQLHQGTEMSLKFFVNAIPGVNRLHITYSDWNGNTSFFAPSDSRPMALLFRQLELRERR